jgi:hypothetical protein
VVSPETVGHAADEAHRRQKGEDRDEAYTVPLLWWNRIAAVSSKLKGWSVTPSHFIGQDLTDVWIEP